MNGSYFRLYLFCFMMFGLVIFSACVEDTNLLLDDSTNTFSGTVTDSATGLAIDSAKISLTDTTLTTFWYTDTLGFYKGVTFGGSITIFVQKSGYRTDSLRFNLSGDPTGIDFQMATN